MHSFHRYIPPNISPSDLFLTHLLSNGPGAPHGPEVAQIQVVCLVLRLIVNLHDDIVHQEGLLSIRSAAMELSCYCCDGGAVWLNLVMTKS